MDTRRFLVLIVAAQFSLAAGCDRVEEVFSARSPLEAVCVDSASDVSEGDWTCPEAFTVECEGGDGSADVASIFVVAEAGSVSDAGASCEGVVLRVNDPGPFAVGTHSIEVSPGGQDAGEGALCEATLTVIDSAAPVVEERTIVLFPPNHKMHRVSAMDCAAARDSCDGSPSVHFLWARSDEPQDDIGDGHSEPDIVVACDRVEVRAERRGDGDGRVYRLGYITEDAAGNRAEGSCLVQIPHDRSGNDAIEGEMAYELRAPSCAGESPAPAPT